MGKNTGHTDSQKTDGLQEFAQHWSDVAGPPKPNQPFGALKKKK